MQSVSDVTGGDSPSDPLILYIGVPYITDCVMAELEKLGSKFKVAQRYETPHEWGGVF